MAAVCMVPQKARVLEGRPAILFHPATVAEAFNPFRTTAGLPLLHAPTDSPNWPPRDVPDGWLCLYSFGLSIYELRQMFGCADTRPPRFQGGIWDWWLQPKEATWVKRQGESGYRLLSLDGLYGYSTWREQEQKIASQGDPAVSRASERLLCEAYFASWLVNGWTRSSDGIFWPWCKYFRHWGKSIGANGERVWTALSYEGIEIGSAAENCSTDPFLRTAICRDLKPKSCRGDS
jgi:hypothetical protein